MILIFTLATGLLIDSLLFFRLARKGSIETVKKYYLYLAIFMLALSLNGYLDFYYMFRQRYLGETGIDSPMVATKGGTYFFLITTTLMFSFFVLTRTIEKYIKQSESMILTKIMFVCFLITLLAFVTPPDVTDQLALLIYATYGPFTLIILYWGVFYLRLGAKSEGVIKTKAYLTGFGLGLIFVGISIQIILRDVAIVIETTGYLFPIIFLIGGNLGVPLLFRGFTKE